MTLSHWAWPPVVYRDVGSDQHSTFFESHL